MQNILSSLREEFFHRQTKIALVASDDHCQ
jgi:hypothetical protein